MAPRLDEFKSVQTRRLFAPSLASSNFAYLVDQILLNPLPVAIPLKIRKAMFQMDGPRQSVHAQPRPVP